MVQGWKVGDKLEALDLHDTEHDLAYVATVSIVMEVDWPDLNLMKAIFICKATSYLAILYSPPI